MIVGLYILGAVVALLAMNCLIGFAVRIRSENLVRSRLADHPFLAITYDDGPSEFMTPRVLDLLDEWNAVATFFVVGRQVAERPEMIERIRSFGHEIGWHSSRHLNAWRSLPVRAVRDVRDMPVMFRNGEHHPDLFRPPYGKATLLTLIAMRRQRQSYAPWTVVSGDTHGTLPSISEVVKQVEQAGGGIVLMHDHDREGQPHGEREEFVLQLTSALLSLARARKWPVLPVSDLAGLRETGKTGEAEPGA